MARLQLQQGNAQNIGASSFSVQGQVTGGQSSSLLPNMQTTIGSSSQPRLYPPTNLQDSNSQPMVPPAANMQSSSSQAIPPPASNLLVRNFIASLIAAAQPSVPSSRSAMLQNQEQEEDPIDYSDEDEAVEEGMVEEDEDDGDTFLSERGVVNT